MRPRLVDDEGTRYDLQSQFNTQLSRLLTYSRLITLSPLITTTVFPRQRVAGLTPGGVEG